MAVVGKNIERSIDVPEGTKVKVFMMGRFNKLFAGKGVDYSVETVGQGNTTQQSE